VRSTAHAGLVEIDAADDGLADLSGGRELFEHVIGDEALIDTAQGVVKSLQHAFQSRHDLGERTPAGTATAALSSPASPGSHKTLRWREMDSNPRSR
jgi:hypothetical protein